MRNKNIPLRNFILIIASIFVVEFMVMYFLDIHSLPPYYEAVADAAFLIIFSFPLLYFLLYLPLRDQSCEKDKAIEAAEEASRAKSEFIANMSHEIRTPLTTILGMVELLQDEPLNDEQKGYIDTLAHGTDNLLAIVNDVLDLSRIESGRVRIDYIDFDLKSEIEAIQDMFRVKAEKRGLTLDFNIELDAPALMKGDPVRLRQVLVNIVSNALKFTSRGGVAITVTMNEEVDDFEALTLLFTVTDTGIGIEKSKVEQIFESFAQANSSTTRSYGGSGLGLYISKKLVELMDGRIWVETEEGRGSSFFFTLPFMASGANDSPEMAGSKAAGSTYNTMRPLHILLVEDTKDIHALVEHYLAHTPYRISIVENGKLALEKIKSNKFDLVLMDMEMPVMDGYTATRKIREWEKEREMESTPIVALTAHALKEFKQRSLDAGCNSHYSKPIRKLELLELIDNHAAC